MRESDYRGQWKEIQVKVKGGDKGTEQITYGWLYLHKVPKMGKLTEKKKVGQRLLGAGSAVDRGGGGLVFGGHKASCWAVSGCWRRAVVEAARHWGCRLPLNHTLFRA